MALKLIIKRQGMDAGNASAEERVFRDEIVSIGSDPSSTVTLNDRQVAGEQALVLNEDGQFLFINRADGTRLNDEVLMREARRPLADGDTLYAGAYAIRFVLDDVSLPANVPRGATSTTSHTNNNTHATRGDEAARDGMQPAQQTAHSVGEGGTPGKSFASILDSLRTEEDSFYFQIETAGRGLARVPVEGAEMVLGWDETGQCISCDAASVVAPRALVRKDWSGVVLQPYGAGLVSVNGEPLEAPRRLRNGERVTLRPTAVAADPNHNYLVFHEPASLVVLDTLLPQQFPPPVPSAPTLAHGANVATAGEDAALVMTTPATKANKRAGLFSSDRRFFGYFTFTEIVIMLVGTLLAAVVIFLFLEYW